MSMIQPVEQATKHPSFEKNNAEKNGSSQNGSGTATISCAACGAVYVPSQAHPYLRHAPPVILESALSSMSHFCFRCRKAACPACWDGVHGICGACVEEVQLTFRVEATPLTGLMFPPARFDQTEQNGQEGQDAQEEKHAVPLLVCIHPGRFQRDIIISTDPLKIVVVAHPPEESLASIAPPRVGVTSDRVGLVPTLANDSQPNLLARIFHVTERIVTIILLIILVAIVVLIVLAEVSVSANAQILRFLHVDIRHEIAYLFSLIQQLRW